MIYRYDGDEWKEAMSQVFADGRARRAYAQRKAYVEPVFAELRLRQGLTRFRRRGRRGASLEFALHCTAYNLKRTLALGLGRKTGFGVYFTFFALSARWWMLFGLLMLQMGNKVRLTATLAIIRR